MRLWKRGPIDYPLGRIFLPNPVLDLEEVSEEVPIANDGFVPVAHEISPVRILVYPRVLRLAVMVRYHAPAGVFYVCLAADGFGWSGCFFSFRKWHSLLSSSIESDRRARKVGAVSY